MVIKYTKISEDKLEVESTIKRYYHKTYLLEKKENLKIEIANIDILLAECNKLNV